MGLRERMREIERWIAEYNRAHERSVHEGCNVAEAADKLEVALELIKELMPTTPAILDVNDPEWVWQYTDQEAEDARNAADD